jgi:hypothetical protein
MSSGAFEDFVMANATDAVGSYLTAQQIFTFFGVAYIVYVAVFVINWIKRRFDMAYRDIHDQQKELIDRTQEKLDKFMARYGRKLHIMEEEKRTDVREYAIALEGKVVELQNMLKNAENTINNLRCDVSVSNANLGNRLVSMRCQTLKDQHDLEDAQNIKSDELTNGITKLTQRLNELENHYALTCQSIREDAQNTKRCELTNDIAQLTQRLYELENDYALTSRCVQEDDELKQVLIGYRYNGDSSLGYRGEPIFCPKYTNELDRYLGNNRALIMLSGIAQLPKYRTFTFADYFYKRESGVKPASSFLDLHMNVVANAVEWGRAQEVREPELVSHYKSAFERVYDYCKAFGVKCV